MQESASMAVGIDVGGTKTHLRACSGTDVVVDTVRPSSGWRPHDPGEAAQWLAALVREALPARARPASVAVGAHGCESPRQGALLHQALGAHLDVPRRIVNDAELLVPALGLKQGVGLVAGTGSVAVGHLADGTQIRVGGWGAVLGDEGSAAGLVREAARAVCAAHDRGDPPDPLTRGLLAALGIVEVPALGGVLEAAADVSAEWGRHADAVFGAAAAGSDLARDVIAAGGRALSALVKRLADRGAVVDDVVLAGGVVLSQAALYSALDDALGRDLPGTRLHPLRVPPVEGAVELARALL
ncbi:BadF/BadG/BcrA/BcrD ATPase family protein [Streptomyces sp. TRM70350]|uniref:N-acetylglucosamine kinase n=1 Tax=Streptomyces sp. TRM70350 TaxID=2856165 RepID=UPI001C437449|nr:BadF/BadG/BcrA/BcrD ATPase family protein [Streptomyces sp. TRM70350]MBV7700104.1 ATPase [Streptomyces sp. TRM70350]